MAAVSSVTSHAFALEFVRATARQYFDMVECLAMQMLATASLSSNHLDFLIAASKHVRSIACLACTIAETATEAIDNFNSIRFNGKLLLGAIRKVAYYIWETSGKTSGHAFDDWLEAERQIDSTYLQFATQYYSCFISFSSKDRAFADRLHEDLMNNDVRCWYAPDNLPIGAKTWDAIDAAIRVHDKLLLILSKSAIASDWVEDEVSKAFAEERRRGQPVLFPVCIDDEVMKTDEPWVVKLRDQRNIGDFQRWEEHDSYREAFGRVLLDLKPTPG
jgi:hypothetical protein